MTDPGSSRVLRLAIESIGQRTLPSVLRQRMIASPLPRVDHTTDTTRTTPLFDVVIPTYNNLTDLRACLGALAEQTIRDFRVLVCVDGSVDGTFDYLASHVAEFDVVTLGHPERGHAGLAATRNLALGHLSGKYLLLLDADMRLDPRALDAHLDLLEAGGRVSVGAIEYTNVELNLWTRYVSTRRLSRWQDRTLVPFNQFTAANAALRTEDFVGLGGFDSGVIGYGGEEFDFAYRLQRQAGADMVFNRSALARSDETKTVDEALAQMVVMGQNLRSLRNKHPSMPYLFRTDKLASEHLSDRIFRFVMNGAVEAAVRNALPRVTFPMQRQMLNYLVIRAVWRGYASSHQS